MDRPELPNARLRLRRVATAPGTPERETSLVLWLDGARLHLSDEAGRPFADIVDDVTAGRGFGRVARSMEDFMDAASPPLRRGPTEIFADGGTGEGVVVEGGGEPWGLPAQDVLGLADLVVAGGRERDLDPVGEQRFLGRDCTRYRFTLDGDEDGVPYRTDVVWLVSGPYLLRREARDAKHGRLSLLTEVTDLAEGAATTDDLIP